MSRWTRAGLALAVAAALGADCQDFGLDVIETVDTFQQERRNAVDLLVVVDNSCSMVEEQDNLSLNFDALIATFSEADVDWRLGVTTTDVETEPFRGVLMGGDDEIILRGPSGELDRVQYNRAWGFEKGRSLQLSAAWFRVTSNDNPANWCPGTAEYGPGHFGTPGQRNGTCDGSEPPTPTPGPDDGPRPPRVQDLLISEILAQSSQVDGATDARCEWVELTNLSDDTLDLSGVLVADNGRHSFDRPIYDERFGPAVIPAGTTVAPHGLIVLGRSQDACGAEVDVVFETNFSLNDDIRWIDRDTPEAEELFAEQVAQGTVGAGIEMGLEAVRLVFDEEAGGGAENRAFLREEAALAILFVTDEEDTSPYPVDAYLRYFQGLKGDAGYRDPGLVTLSGVIGVDPPPRPDLPACASDNGIAFYGRRYIEAALRTGGLTESICDEDFAPIVSRLGLTLSGLSQQFGLSKTPNLDTMRVLLYSDPDTLERELQRDVDFTYIPDDNAIRFTEEQVPPSQWYVVARYVALPTGSVDVDPDTEADTSAPEPAR